jgi:restriction system protein
LRVTERGQLFLDEPTGHVVAEIDSYEGILTILQIVAEKGPGRRSDLLPAFATFCQAFTSYRSESVIKGALYDRLTNLIAREYVLRRSQTYRITDVGLAYLERYANLVPGRKAGDKQSKLRRLTKEISEDAREQLGEYLAQMDPFKFEELIQFLLEEMGYTDVETTSPTHDKGVDVVANIDLGISSVREVIQVKRHKGNINRTVLDQLRGSLYRFEAVRGTIITTGGFSRGTKRAAFERGAPPITLIDGEKLLDLLIEREIGVTKNTIEYIDFDVNKLTQFESEEAEGPEV